MRILLALSLLFLAGNIAMAQDQENKLVDRLLRPDTSLQNSAQNKKFVADKRSVDKRANVSTFYIQQRPRPKIFAATPEYSTAQFNSHSSYKTNAASVSTVGVAQRTYSTSSAGTVQRAHDGNKTATTRDFSGNRPFLDRGKSQKALNAHDQPLTIEQVRELLNKNK